MGDDGDGVVEEEVEAAESEEEVVLEECMAMRMRRAEGEADVMGDGGAKEAASDDEVGEARRLEAAEELDDTCSESCFFGVTIAVEECAGSADDAADDEALSAFFFPTGVTATGLLLPAPASPADDEAVNVVTILPLLPLGEFSTARRRALSLGWGEADLDEAEVRSAARSRISAGVMSLVSRDGGWGLRAGTGCLVASMREYEGEGRDKRAEQMCQYNTRRRMRMQ